MDLYDAVIYTGAIGISIFLYAGYQLINNRGINVRDVGIWDLPHVLQQITAEDLEYTNQQTETFI